MKKKALIVWGGWEGHQPDLVANRFKSELIQLGVEVEVSDTLDAFSDDGKLKELDLIIPIWTMDKINNDYVVNICEAVANGTGLAGCHGGMCDAFRENVLWQFITGGNWVSHPGGDTVEYTVHIRNSSSPLVDGIADFKVKSEQYYLHVDPANEILATTVPASRWYHSANGQVDMPVVWTRKWGVGRVYYNSLGHHADTFDIPEAMELMRRGIQWALDGKQIARNQGLSSSLYASEDKNF